MAARITSESIARSCATHARRTLLIWLVVLVAGFLAIGSLCSSAITNTDTALRQVPESVRAQNLLDERFAEPGAGEKPESVTEILVVRSRDATVDDEAYRSRVETVFAAVETEGSRQEGDLPVVLATISYYGTGDESLVSTDRHSMIGNIVFAGDVDHVIDQLPPFHKIVEEANRGDGYEFYLVGNASFAAAYSEIAESDLLTGEIIGTVVALIILAIVFRTLGAAPVPILLAVVTITMAIAATALIGQLQPVSFFIINMITMIGLAVGIDYSLFIIGRYREERANGREKIEAISMAGATATRSVFFSGVTVVIALLGMLVVPHSIYFSLGLGAILAAVMAVAAALTLLPAVLSLLGDKVNAIRIPLLGRANVAHDRGFWHRFTLLVMANPAKGLILSAGFLILCAIPAMNLKTGAAGAESISDEHPEIRGYNILIEDFSSGLIETTDIVIDAPDVTAPDVAAGIARLQAILAKDDRFTPVELRVSPNGDLGLLALPVNSATTNESFETVRELRNDIVPAAGIPATVYVGGSAAGNVDFIAIGDNWLPYVVIFVLAMSFILLAAVFRSVVVPLKAIIMNLLSVGATYGLITLVFIDGFGANLLGFTPVDAIDSWIPLFLFCVLFGLSMDYHVILLSRIRERYGETHDNERSVAFGLQSTAGMITGAAVIMVAVFMGFALAELAMFQQMGFGLAVAVFLDATIVRSILVPASMKLLGNRNWYLPGFLSWLPDLRVEHAHADIGASGAAAPRATAMPTGASAEKERQ